MYIDKFVIFIIGFICFCIFCVLIATLYSLNIDKKGYEVGKFINKDSRKEMFVSFYYEDCEKKKYIGNIVGKINLKYSSDIEKVQKEIEQRYDIKNVAIINYKEI